MAVKLASWAEEMRHVGKPDATGVDATVSVLGEAAEVANNLLGQLANYVAAARRCLPKLSAPTASMVGERPRRAESG